MGSGISKTDADSTYAQKSQITSILSQLNDTAKTADLSSYIKLTDLLQYAKLTDIPDVTVYALKNQLSDYSKVSDLELYVKKSDLPDLSVYAKTADLSSYATNAKVDNLVSATTLKNMTSGITTSNVLLPNSGGGWSKIYDNGHLHLDTDDNMYFDSNGVNKVNISPKNVNVNGVNFTDAYSDYANTSQSEIVNDTGNFKTLMLIGNKALDKSTRTVSVWDKLTVNGDTLVTGSQTVNGSSIIKGNLNVNGVITGNGWSGPYKLVFYGLNNKCGDVGQNNGFGTNTCDPGDNAYQKFYYNTVTGQLYNQQNKKCLDAGDGNTFIWHDCNDHQAQSWMRNKDTLQNGDGKCVDLGNGNSQHSYACNVSNNNQRIRFIPYSNNRYPNL